MIRERSVTAAQTVMVGDSSVDVLTAKNAGAIACGVSWGFQPETFVATPPDFIIDDMRALADMILAADGRV